MIYLWSYRSADEMYHYGIKGMKWGVRRFETKGGKLTPAGKKRYADDSVGEKKPKKQLKIPDKKSKHRTNLEEKYKQKGMSQQEAEQAAARRIRGEKYAAAAAAVTVASCVAYCKYKNFTTDKELSENTDFQRIMNLVNGQEIENRDRMYVAYDKKDKAKYKGLLGDSFNQQNKQYEKLWGDEMTDRERKAVYDVGVKAKQKIKVASRKRVEDTFAQLYKNDPDFKKEFENTVKKFELSPNVQNSKKLRYVADKVSAGKQLNDLEIKKAAYDIFNIGIADSDPAAQANSKKLFDALKKQGVNAIKDMNDSKYSGYGSKDPLIIFDGAFDYAKREMGEDELASYAKKAKGMITREALVKEGVKTGAAIGAMAVANNKINQVAVNKYRKEHPNSKLTDKEIIKMLNGQR